MNREARRQVRRPIDCEVTLSWYDREAGTQFARGRGMDMSEAGARIETEQPLTVGSCVFARVPEYLVGGTAYVRHCTRRGSKYVVGLEIGVPRAGSDQATDGSMTDYYELLQISPAAEMETIHRVYKIMVTRYHPDNPHTGDAEKFLRLTRAYQTLSDPNKRAAYDASRRRELPHPLPVFELKEFVTGVDAETNRRLGILCLLYNRRRLSPDWPGLSLLDFESLMAIPREHLLFTVWFLKERHYLRPAEGAQFEITSEGVEFVESSLPARTIFQRLLRGPQDEAGFGPPEGRAS